jgi:glutamine amidotransferase
MKIVIIDYGMGNLHSVKRKLHLMGVDHILSSNPKDIVDADKIILPGVGHFEHAMNNLKSLGLLDALNEAALIKQKPILGICLGMQIMARQSEEGNSMGLGWFDADVRRFRVSDMQAHKVPHTGWNTIHISKESVLMKNIEENAEFYFVHAYHMICHDKSDVLNTTEYSYHFDSAIQKNNIFGVQYHPEKSHTTGFQLLKNFIAI